MRRHKYAAQRTFYGSRFYDSKREAHRAGALDLMIKGGLVSYWLPQVPIQIRPVRIDQAGTVVDKGEKYIVDFQIFWVDGSVTYEDVKGMRTATYKRKKKMVEALYPIQIIEV